jgi:CRP-like cAMP-binding protein
MNMSAKEQKSPGARRRMSIVLWDMFTGSAPYREIFGRTLDPRFLGRFLWESLLGIGAGRRTRRRKGLMHEGALGKEYAHGDVICRQGERGDRMFVIEEGRAEVVRDENGLEAVVGELAAGDIFGEMAIFERQPRSATVRARGTTRVLTLDKRGFLQRVHDDPSTAYRIIEGMSRRIRSLDAELSRLKGHAEGERGERTSSPSETSQP